VLFPETKNCPCSATGSSGDTPSSLSNVSERPAPEMTPVNCCGVVIVVMKRALSVN
jgi:hypothetical protein